MNIFAFLLALFSPTIVMRTVRGIQNSDDAAPTAGASASEDFLGEDFEAPKSAASQPIESNAQTTPAEAATPSEPVVSEVVDPNPVAPIQTGTTTEAPEVIQEITSDGTVEAMAGRVATLMPVGEDIVSVRIVGDVAHGNITVNPDNSFALVMTQSDFVGAQAFQYEATHSDGSTSIHEVTINVGSGAQEGGWGTGEKHYMLETDDDDRIVVEHGENHQKVYISGSEDALSREDIAALEGVSVETVTGQWLAANGEYGFDTGSALDADIGMDMWRQVTPKYSEKSNWLLFERGYDYEDLGRIMMEGTNGESELTPNFIGAYGEGESPRLNSEFMQFQESSANLVVQDVTFGERVNFLDAKNVIFDNVSFEDSFAAKNSSGFTVRNSDIVDVIREESLDGGDWEAHLDRISGFYADAVDGLLFEGNFIDHSGWADDFNEDGSADGGQAPNKYSQNLYLNYLNEDVTLRDTISMRAASFGAQVRSGGFIEDNVFLDNNAAFYTAGGNDSDGQYTLYSNNVITSGAHKIATQIGGKTLGIWDQAEMTSYVDSIVAHLADPNSDELDWKTTTNHAMLQENEAFSDDTIIHNWQGADTVWGDLLTEKNNEGLDHDVLDQTTIQNFAAQLLGKEDATIADLANHLRAQADGKLDDVVDADLIINFFQTGFGIAPDLRETETMLRFVPNELGEGVRWDNRLNWDTQDLPGTREGDSVNLGGNEVVFGANSKIKTLDFGNDGALNVYGGKLELSEGIATNDSGSLNVTDAGQLWTEGTSGSGDVDVDVTGGRFVNTGEVGNVDLHADDGQSILASGDATFNVTDGHVLTVESDAKVGFDGDGKAILDLHEGATLAFNANDGDLGEISEFDSGAFDGETDTQSGVHLGDSTLKVDLTGLQSSAKSTFKLIDADMITGLFKKIDIQGLGDRDAEIVMDYEADNVFLSLTSGTGNVTTEVVGNESDGAESNNDLWTTLTDGHGSYDETPVNHDPESLSEANAGLL